MLLYRAKDGTIQTYSLRDGSDVRLLESGVKGMSGKTEKIVEALEDYVLKKVTSFDEMTSPEETMALAELVRTITIVKKSNGISVNS